MIDDISRPYQGRQTQRSYKSRPAHLSKSGCDSEQRRIGPQPMTRQAPNPRQERLPTHDKTGSQPITRQAPNPLLDRPPPNPAKLFLALPAYLAPEAGNERQGSERGRSRLADA